MKYAFRLLMVSKLVHYEKSTCRRDVYSTRRRLFLVADRRRLWHPMPTGLVVPVAEKYSLHGEEINTSLKGSCLKVNNFFQQS